MQSFDGSGTLVLWALRIGVQRHKFRSESLVKRAWLALVFASLLGCVFFGLLGIIALPFMLGTSAVLFIVCKARGGLQWWQAALGGFLGGAAWSLLFSATSSFEYFDSFGLPNATIWAGIGTVTALLFWWLGLYRNTSFPGVNRAIPHAMLLLVPIAVGGVALHRATNVLTFAQGRITGVAGEAPTRRVTVRLSNGANVQTELRNDSRPSSLLINQCWHLDNTWSLSKGHRVYHLEAPFGGGVNDCGTTAVPFRAGSSLVRNRCRRSIDHVT
jgi:hypothetical protein